MKAPPPTLAETMHRLTVARDAFWFSLGAYALMTQAPTNELLTNYRIVLTNDKLAVEPLSNKQTARGGMSYSLAFDTPLTKRPPKR